MCMLACEFTLIYSLTCSSYCAAPSSSSFSFSSSSSSSSMQVSRGREWKKGEEKKQPPKKTIGGQGLFERIYPIALDGKIVDRSLGAVTSTSTVLLLYASVV